MNQHVMRSILPLFYSLFCDAIFETISAPVMRLWRPENLLTQTLTQMRKGLERSGENGDSRRSAKAGHKRGK